MPGNGAGNGNGGNGGVHPRDPAVPWEEIRSLVWELKRCRELSQCAFAVRNIDGERVIVGYSEAKLMVGIDLARIIERLGKEIGHHRQERFADWVAGIPVARLGKVEQIQLEDDVRRVEEMVNAGGYRFMLTRRDASGA